jgi:hypothetical protein
MSVDVPDVSVDNVSSMDVASESQRSVELRALVEQLPLSGGGETAIPSESSITAAKQKRDRLRKAPEDDYISLTVSKYDSGSQGPHPESRLVREEDELGEGDDGESRSLVVILAFTGLFVSDRIRRIHKRSRTNRFGQEITQERSQ